MDVGLELIDGWRTAREVRAFDDALGIISGTPSSPGWTTRQDEQGRRVIVTEPGSQAPGVTNGVALRLPLLKPQSYNENAMASGSYAQEALTKVSAGTNLMAERKATCMLRKVYCMLTLN
jgi:hypothetical protein